MPKEDELAKLLYLDSIGFFGNHKEEQEEFPIDDEDDEEKEDDDFNWF